MVLMELEYTGERMVPEAADPNTFWEHVRRYQFALSFIRGRRVLDIACGEGYGTAAIRTGGASEVIGVDINPEACEHARRKYAVDARVGSAEKIPIATASMDVVVSFETIEHAPSPSVFINECARVLRPGGKLIISTPNKAVYTLGTPSNPYHCSELTIEEFRSVLLPSFQIDKLYGQVSKLTPAWSAASLANPRSFWYQTRGFRRAMALAAKLAGFTGNSRLSTARSNTVDEIQRPQTWTAKVFDPYQVRSVSKRVMQSSVYVVAVATRV